MKEVECHSIFKTDMPIEQAIFPSQNAITGWKNCQIKNNTILKSTIIDKMHRNRHNTHNTSYIQSPLSSTHLVQILQYLPVLLQNLLFQLGERSSTLGIMVRGLHMCGVCDCGLCVWRWVRGRYNKLSILWYDSLGVSLYQVYDLNL